MSDTQIGFLVTVGVTIIGLLGKWYIDKRMEKVKADLQKEGKHTEIQFLKLRERQIAVFEEFYAKLSLTYSSALETVHIAEFTEFKGRLDKFLSYYDDFIHCYRSKKIFLTEDICSLTEILDKNIVTAVRARRSFDNEGIPYETRDANWMQGYESVSVDCKKLMEEVESTFRKLLGVSPS